MMYNIYMKDDGYNRMKFRFTTWQDAEKFIFASLNHNKNKEFQVTVEIEGEQEDF